MLINKNYVYLLLLIITTTFYILFKNVGQDFLCNGIYFFLVLIIIISSVNQLTYMMFFFTPLFLYITFGSFPLFNVIILTLLFKRILIEKVRFNNIQLLLMAAIIIIELLGILLLNSSISFNAIKMLLIILLVYMMLFSPSNGFKSENAINSLIFGTGIFAIMFIIINFGVVFHDSYRIGGLGTLDPNTYGLYNLLVVALLAHQVITKKMSPRKIIFYLLLAIVIFVAGLMTLSKTYIILSVLTVLMFAFVSITDFKKLISVITIIILSAALLNQIPYLNELFNSLLFRFEKAETLSELTTSRSDIYKYYITYLFQHPKTLIMGNGLTSYFSEFVVRPHNSIIELLMSWGIVGTSLFVIMNVKGYITYKRKKDIGISTELVNFIPLIIFFLYIQSLTLMYQEVTYIYLVLTLIIAAGPETNKNGLFQVKPQSSEVRGSV